jgi:plasmid stabilization system protein ParE
MWPEQRLPLVRREGGDIRADKFLARIEAFVRRLADFSDIGTRHDHHAKGLNRPGFAGGSNY